MADTQFLSPRAAATVEGSPSVEVTRLHHLIVPSVYTLGLLIPFCKRVTGHCGIEVTAGSTATDDPEGRISGDSDPPWTGSGCGVSPPPVAASPGEDGVEDPTAPVGMLESGKTAHGCAAIGKPGRGATESKADPSVQGRSAAAGSTSLSAPALSCSGSTRCRCLKAKIAPFSADFSPASSIV